MHAIIEARKVEKSYGSEGAGFIQVIAPLDLAIYPGEILALLGPSGSGKSTLLRILTGLAAPTAGAVIHHGHEVSGPCENVSIVFQSFALFPWLTVLENVEAPLKARGVPAAERTERSVKILDTVGLDGFENAYPKELSGGMKQRVGFARALVVEPEVLFMDEPFSALDVLTAENLRGELLELWQSHKMPTRAVFMVTHNIEEAVLLADRIVVLGKNPATIRTDFRVLLARPRERKDPRFTNLVDYIYRVLTQPDLAPALQPVSAPVPQPSPSIRCCRTHAAAQSPACWKCWWTATAATISTGWRPLIVRNRRPAADRRRRRAAGFCQGGGRRRGDYTGRPGLRGSRHLAAQRTVPRRRAGQHRADPRDQALAGQRRPHAARRSSSKTCWTSTSARRKPRRNSKRPSTGAATRNCSITIPRPAVLHSRGSAAAAAPKADSD